MCSLDLKCEKLNMNCACNQSHHIITHFAFIIRHVCLYMYVHCLDIQQMLSALTSLYWIMNLKLRCAFLWSLPSRLRFSFDPSFVSIFLLHFVLQRLGFQCNFINFLKYNIDAGCITVIYSLATALMLNLVFPLERCGALCQYLWL